MWSCGNRLCKRYKTFGGERGILCLMGKWFRKDLVSLRRTFEACASIIPDAQVKKRGSEKLRSFFRAPLRPPCGWCCTQDRTPGIPASHKDAFMCPTQEVRELSAWRWQGGWRIYRPASLHRPPPPPTPPTLASVVLKRASGLQRSFSSSSFLAFLPSPADPALT